MNFAVSDVRDGIILATIDIASGISNLAGVFVDDMRLGEGWELNDGRVGHADITITVSGLSNACNAAGVLLSVGGVPISTSGVYGYAYDIKGCSQEWHRWLNDGLVDYTLQGTQYESARLEQCLGCGLTLAGVAYSGTAYGVCPYTFLDDTPGFVSSGEWALMLDRINLHGFNIAVYDDTYVSSGLYQNALASRPLS
jgi:hypothetical protein